MVEHIKSLLELEGSQMHQTSIYNGCVGHNKSNDIPIQVEWLDWKKDRPRCSLFSKLA